MKLCAVTTWPPHRDGVALYSAELYKHVKKHVTVEIVANNTKQKPTEPQNSPVSFSWKRNPFYPKAIFRAVHKTRCNVVHLQHGWQLYGNALFSVLFPVLLLMLRLSRKPCVVTMHTVIRKNAHIFNNSVINFLAQMTVLFISRSIVCLSDNVIVHNHLMKKVLQTEYGANTEKITVIPHGSKKSSDATFSENHKDISILSLGFLRKGKGFKYLFEAFEELLANCPKAKLVIVGDKHAHDKTGYSDCFTQLSLNIQKRVQFTGFVDETTLEQLIWESDVIVLQSTEPYYVEASGVLAAVADYGKSVVCSKVPKFQAEIKNGKNGIIVEPSDSAQLAQAFIDLMENPELRKRLGKNLKEKFETRRWSNVAEQHVALYRSILAGAASK